MKERQSPEASTNPSSGEATFLAELPTIERAIRFTCWRASLVGADVEDFGSWVKLKLIENDYTTLRKFEHRCSFAAYIGIVVQRLLLDYRVHLWGKWHASAEAKRMGDFAVAVESHLVRDGLSIADALPALRCHWPDLTEQRVREIAARLPSRHLRARTVELDLAENAVSPTGIQEMALERDRTDLAARIAAVVHEALDAYDEDDRLLLRLRFQSGNSIADIARMLAVEQKPLYRRLQRLLADLRARLRRQNINADDVETVIGTGGIGVDLGFEDGTPPPCPSNETERKSSGEDEAP